MAYLFEPEVTSLPIEGDSRRFPVRRIYCVGRNYAAHAREMGHDPDREPPFFFMKPAGAIVQNGSTIPFPPATKDLHHEIELVVAIGKGGANIPVEKALDHVFGYGVGIDLTRRDVQQVAKDLRRPWDMGKGFDNAGPCTAIKPVAMTGHPEKGSIWIKVNGESRQSGDLNMQIWKVPETIAYISTFVALQPGDLIFNGTPEGVSKVQPGDKLEGHVDGVGDLTITIAR